MDIVRIVWSVVLFAGLFTLAGGYFLQDRRCHLLRIAGFALLAVFFTSEVLRIVAEGKDLWNVTFTAFTPPIFAFVAWQEWLSYAWDEDHRSLRWLAGTAWMAGVIYYAFDRIPVLTAGIVYVVAGQTIWLGQAFGYGKDFAIDQVNWGNEQLSVSITNSPVSIILGCTGIEAIVIFVGAILATRLEADPWAAFRDADSPRSLRYRAMSGRERVARALLYTTSIIWVGNLIRNIGIIYLVDVQGWDFDVAHGDLGKGSSFVILLVLAFVTFNLLPEMLDNISGIYDLRKRVPPWERKGRGEGKAAAEEPRADAVADAAEGAPDAKGGPADDGADEAPDGPPDGAEGPPEAEEGASRPDAST